MFKIYYVAYSYFITILIIQIQEYSKNLLTFFFCFFIMKVAWLLLFRKLFMFAYLLISYFFGIYGKLTPWNWRKEKWVLQSWRASSAVNSRGFLKEAIEGQALIDSASSLSEPSGWLTTRFISHLVTELIQ